MTVKVEYSNDRAPAQDGMTVEAKAIITAAIAYVLAGDLCPHELYAALEEAVLAYVPPMRVEIIEEEEEGS